jgi:hypothetical protein
MGIEVLHANRVADEDLAAVFSTIYLLQIYGWFQKESVPN